MNFLFVRSTMLAGLKFVPREKLDKVIPVTFLFSFLFNSGFQGTVCFVFVKLWLIVFRICVLCVRQRIVIRMIL